jgi:hypothetical protein
MNRSSLDAHVMSTKIVEAIWNNLDGRGGFDWWVSDIDPDTLKEIHESLRESVKDVLEKVACERDTDNDGDCARCAHAGGCIAVRFRG